MSRGRAGWAHRLWAWSSRGAARRLRVALDDPQATQRRLLRRHLETHTVTAYGRRHGFAGISSYEAYSDRTPVVTWDDLVPWIERVRAGEPRVLTAEAVDRLVPSSGSTAAVKLVPYTPALRTQLREAVGAWIHDLSRRHPGALEGRAYWSVSPAVEPPAVTSSIPVGFDDDTAYLGGFARRLAAATLAVRPELRLVTDPEEFRYRTLRHLTAARDLSLISVWHPTFLILLLDALPALRDRLAADIGRGDPARGRTIASLDLVTPDGLMALWPDLALVSAWGDGPAAGPFRDLQDRFAGVAFQPKGLLATEGVVTVPLGDGHPMAVTSHVLELVGDDGRAVLPGDPSLERGGTYGVLLTTGGGLHRYRLGDRVRITGFAGRTPSLAFVGRNDRVSDLVGEKLSEGFVAGVLEDLLAELDPRFAQLAPTAPMETAPPGYALHLEVPGGLPDETARRLAAALDQALAANPHYRWARDLGQLAPAHVVPLRDGHGTHLRTESKRGRKLGDVKPASLSLHPLS